MWRHRCSQQREALRYGQRSRQWLDFIIPDYQRGYRWEELQVVELLKDLSHSIENSRTGFYCLQPLVVKRSIVDHKAFYEQMRGKLTESVVPTHNASKSNIVINGVISGNRR